MKDIFDLLNMLNIFKVYLPRFLHWPVVVDQALQKPDLQKSKNLKHIVLNKNKKVEEKKKKKKGAICGQHNISYQFLHIAPFITNKHQPGAGLVALWVSFKAMAPTEREIQW